MKTQVFFLLAYGHAAIAAVFEARATCPQGNNCARAVYGTAKGTAYQAQATKDCNSFNLVTVTPAPYTSTITVLATVTTTVDVTSVTTIIEYTQPPPPPPPAPPAELCEIDPFFPGCPGVPLAKRTTTQAAQPTTAVTVTPTGIPTYASACTNAPEYSSACSCLGVHHLSTFTAPTPTVLTTITDTQTTTLSSFTVSTTTACPSPSAVARYDAADDNGSCSFNAENAYGYSLTPDTCVAGTSWGRGVAVSVKLQGAAGPGQDCVVSMYSSSDCNGGPFGTYDLAQYSGGCIGVSGDNLGSMQLHCQCD